MGTRNVGTLSAKLSANATEFKSAMKEARVEVKDTAKSVVESNDRIKAAISDRDAFEQQVQKRVSARLRILENAKIKEAVAAEAAVRLQASGMSEADATGKKAGKGYAEGFFSELNSTFGKRSVMGKALKIAAGGGAIGALGMAASEFNNLAKSVESFSVAMSQGGDEWKSALGDMLASVPILGKVGEGFYHLWNAMTGRAAVSAASADAAKTVAEIKDLWTKISENTDRATASAAEYSREVRNHIALLGLKGIDRAMELSRQEEKTKVEDVKKDREASSAKDKELVNKRAELIKKMRNEAKALGVEFGDNAPLNAQKFDTPLLGGSYMQVTDLKAVAKFRASYAWYAGEIEGIDQNLAASRDKTNAAAESQIADAARKGAADRKRIGLDAMEALAEQSRGVWTKFTTEASDAARKARADVNAAMKGARDEFETEGLSPSERKLRDFKRLPGATAGDIAAYRAQLDMNDALKSAADWIEEIQKRGEKMRDSAAAGAKKEAEEIAKLKEKTLTPREEFEQTATKLANWRATGKITGDEFKRATQNAWKDLEKTIDVPDSVREMKSPDLIMAGSAQAQRMAYDNAAGNVRMSKDDELKQRQLTEAQKSNLYLERMATDLHVETVNIAP